MKANNVATDPAVLSFHGVPLPWDAVRLVGNDQHLSGHVHCTGPANMIRSK